MSVSRRAFVTTAAAAARVLGANERIRLGIIGTGGRGSYLMNVANKVGGIEWVAVCDAW
ncbi:MAG: gfo/Idh/MocA family oxidoreductase, partial [Acidobacteria bacterium]|nr:gfo/Idh/MocA family oxidoreductase [Acidobacteriota bacterium]